MWLHMFRGRPMSLTLGGMTPIITDYTQVGTWLQTHYGQLSAVAAVVRIHAVINQNYTVCYPPPPLAPGCPVPVTLMSLAHSRLCTIIRTPLKVR